MLAATISRRVMEIVGKLEFVTDPLKRSESFTMQVVVADGDSEYREEPSKSR
jgi:hypothetical protein